MIKEVIIWFTSITALLLVFAGVSFADSNGIWLNVEDLRGGNSIDSAQYFGDDEIDAYEYFGFESGNLVIGRSGNDAILNFQGGSWTIGILSDSFIIADGANTILSADADITELSSDLVRVENDLDVGNDVSVENNLQVMSEVEVGGSVDVGNNIEVGQDVNIGGVLSVNTIRPNSGSNVVIQLG